MSQYIWHVLSTCPLWKQRKCPIVYIIILPIHRWRRLNRRRMSQYIQSKRFWVGFYLNLHFIWLDWIYFVTQSDLFKYWKLSVHPITWFKCTCEVILINLVCVWFTVICGFNYAVDIFVLRLYSHIMSVHIEMQSWNEAIDVMMLKTTWRSECFMRIVVFKLCFFLLFLTSLDTTRVNYWNRFLLCVVFYWICEAPVRGSHLVPYYQCCSPFVFYNYVNFLDHCNRINN